MPKILIGSDPEAVIMDDMGELVPANEFDRSFTTSSKIGCDGHSATLEIRPTPKDCPLKHFNEIEKLLKELNKKLPRGYEIRAGSYQKNKPIGGHIHFSGIELTPDLIRALNTYLAIPMLMLESPDEAKNRRMQYGTLTHQVTRTKEWGFEYRPLASWLVDRELTRAVLCLAWVIAHEYKDGKQFLVKEYGVFVDDKAFKDCDKKQFSKFIIYLFNNIVCMKEYPKYAEHINIIFSRIKNEITAWDENVDVMRKWGLKDIKDLMTKVVFTKGIGLQYIKSKIKIPEDDTSQDICVYGMSKERGDGYDVLVSTEEMKKLLAKKFPDLVIDVASIGKAASSYRYSIGFSYSIRTEKSDDGSALKNLCVKIMQYLLNNFEGMIKKDLENKRESRGSTTRSQDVVDVVDTRTMSRRINRSRRSPFSLQRN